MIKHIPNNYQDILSFYVETEMDEEDVAWMVRLIESTYERTGKRVLLSVEFGAFGRLTVSRTLRHWKMLFKYRKSLMAHVDKIAAATDSVVLRSKLLVEFNLLPFINLRAYTINHKERGIDWLLENSRPRSVYAHQD